MKTEKAKPTRIDRKTRYHIQKRKEWRARALNAAIEFTTWPAGKPEREKCEAELAKALNKVRQWFRGGPRANLVIHAVQRRAVRAFHAQAVHQ